MLADFHVHSPYCGHAHGKIVQYVESAVASGLKEIGFADHLGRYYLSKSQRRRHWDWGMHERDLPRYVSEILDIQDVFQGQIKIRIGLEIDYIEGAEELLNPLLRNYPLDFCIGSIHCLPKFTWKHLADYKGADPLLIYREYFSAAQAALKSGLFNSLAHLDFIWRYVQWPEHGHDEIIDKIDETLIVASQHKTCIEVNANGFIWSQSNQPNGFNPFSHMLETIQKFSIPISIGSDAHEPAMVGKAFPDLISLLHKKGITEFCCFSEGKATIEKLGN